MSDQLKKQQQKATKQAQDQATEQASAAMGSPPVGSLMELIKSLQFAWFIGHVITIVSALNYVFSYNYLSRSSSWFNTISYKLLYLSVIESFGIIILQSYGLNFQNIGKLIHDDNFQYLFIAVLLFLSPIKYSLSILPFLFFALFHSANYIQSVILPLMRTKTPVNYQQYLIQISMVINWFSKMYQEKLIQLASNIEILNFFIIFLKSLWLWRNWINVLIYAIFIKLRYMNSIYIRKFFSQLEVSIDGIVSSNGVPVQIKKIWSILKSKIKFIGQYDLITKKDGTTTATLNEPGSKKKQ